MKKFLLFGLGAIVLLPIGLVSYVKLALPNVGPAPELSIDITPERVARGSYLGQLCLDCHSHRDYGKWGGPVIPGTEGMGGERFSKEMLDEVPGEIFAPNITPYALANWTDGEIYRAITAGVSKDGRPLFPLMPWVGFGQLPDEDVYDIIAYVRSLKPIPNDVPKSKLDFPLNILVHTIPFKQEVKVDPRHPDIIQRGSALLTVFGCEDCHTPISKGEPIAGMRLAGGMEFKLADGSIVRPANLTPETETGIGRLSADDFVRLFKKYQDSAYVTPVVPPGEFNTYMPWEIYSKITEDDLRAIYAYLRTVEPVKNPMIRFEPGPVAKK